MFAKWNFCFRKLFDFWLGTYLFRPMEYLYSL